MTWWDVVVFENVWEVLEGIAYGIPVTAVLCGSIWWLVKKTTYED